MDAAELPLPAAVGSNLMRSPGCSGGCGVTRVELVTSQFESATCSSSFRAAKGNNCNVNGSRPAFWNNVSDIDLHRQGSPFSCLGNEEALVDHHMGRVQISFDMTSISQAKQSQWKSGKAARSNGNISRRSRVAHMEASFNATGSLYVNGSLKDLGLYPAKCNLSEQMQTSKQKTLSVKRSEKRNSKILKGKCDSFSVKAGLSSFSSAAGANNIYGVYGSKQEICDVTKHVDELSLNALLDGSYKCPQSVKEKGTMSKMNENILHSVRDACSILQLRKSIEPQNMPVVDITYQQNASSFCLQNSGTSGASKSKDSKGNSSDLSFSSKVENSCSCLVDRPYILEFPLFAPKDVMDRLALYPPKDLDLLLLDSTKPSTSKGNLDSRPGKPVQGRGSLPPYSWSHISGGHFKSNPDVVKLTSNKSTCQGRWAKIVSSTTFGDTATFLADLGSLVYDQNLVPLGCQLPGPTEDGTYPLPVDTDTSFEEGVRSFGDCTIASSNPDGHAPGVLDAAQTLCEIATQFKKQDQNAIIKWSKKPSQKSMKATKLKSDQQLEKELFTSSKPSGLDACEARHDNGLTKRQFTTPLLTRLSNKRSKLQKLVPTHWKSPSNNRSASDGGY